MIQEQEELLTKLHKIMDEIKYAETEREEIILELSNIMKLNTVREPKNA